MRVEKHFYILYLFQLENNCFTILCWLLPYINMNQPEVYICPLPLEPSTLFHPSTLSESTRFELYSKFSLVILHMVMYTFQCYFPNLLHPLLPLLCLQVCSLYLCIQYCLAHRFISPIFVDSIYIYIYIYIYMS